MSSIEFGSLRSLVYQTPSIKLFHQLLDIVETFNEAQQEQWIPYLDQQLESWPDKMRCCPQSRLKVLEQAPLLWTPLLRYLNYEGEHLTNKRFELILKSTHLQHITHLNLSACRFKWSDLLKLADAAPFTQLKSFTMRKSTSSGADKNAIETLFQTSMLAQLEHLSFDGWSGIKSFVLGLLADAPFLSTLKSLNLSGCKVSTKRLKEILSKPELAGLECFDMGYQSANASKGRLSVLNHSTHLTNLHSLNFSGFETEELIKFAQSSHLKSLRKLRLALVDNLSNDDPVMDDEAIVQLCQSPHINKLESLELNMNLLKNSTIRTLVGAPSMQNLRELKIVSRAYTNWGLTRPSGQEYLNYIEALLSSNLLGQLNSIQLANLNPTIEEFEMLMTSPLIANLENLHLIDRTLSLEHIYLLAHSTQLKKLKSLTLSNNMLSINLLKTILFSGHFPILEHLDMSYVRTNDELNKETVAHILKREGMPRHLTVDIWFR